MLSRAFFWLAWFAALAGGPAPFAWAAIDTWDNVPGINWNNDANWADGSTPGINDSATFNLAQSYTVTFPAAPAIIQAATISAGAVTFQSSGGARTLQLLAAAGSQDLTVTGANTSLTLGTANNPLHVTAGDDLSIQAGATVVVQLGSQLTANDLSASGLNGTLRVDGTGSTLTLGGNIANVIAATGAASLVFQNGATGNSINGSLGLASTTATNTTANLSLLTGSTLTLGGNLMLANQNAIGQTATLSINGTNSALTQIGTSTITLGSAANGVATIAIGTTTSGGTLSTGAGLFTINKTATVTLGNGSNTGTLLANGDLTINGGLLQKTNAASVFDLAAGRTITLQAGGRLTHVGALSFDSNQSVLVTGANSKLEVTGTSAIAVGSGAQLNLAAAGVVTAAGKIDLANGGAGSGTLTATGEGTTISAGNEVSTWGNGGSAAVTLSNKATANFSAGLDIANAAAAGTAATITLQTGAALNTGTLNIATAGGSTTNAVINIHGDDSRIVQTGAATLTLGHASAGTAAINIGTAADGGSLTTGSGLLLVNKTGAITVGNGANAGTLEVLGNLTIDGGQLQIANDASVFAWTTGKTLTVQNGGRVRFASDYITAANAQHVVKGANSKFEISGALQLRGAAQVGVSEGAALAADSLQIGGGGTAGSFIADGAGTTITGGDSLHLWGSGGAATVTFSNNTNANFAGSVRLAESGATYLNVLSGADLTLGDLSIAAVGGTVAGTLNVFGIGTSATVSNLTVGHIAAGTGAIYLEDGGTLSVASGGTTSVLGTGTVNIASGVADLRALSIVGGTVNVNGGKLVFSSLSVTGGAVKFNAGRIEQTGQLVADETLLTTLLGTAHELGAGRTLAAANGAANLTTRLDLNGGRLEGNSLSVANAGLNATVLRIRNGGVAQFSGGATLAAGTNTYIEDGSALVAGGQLTQESELQLAGTGRIAAATLVNLGLFSGAGRIDANLNNQALGQIRLAADERLLVRGTRHQNNGLIDIDGGELEIATGAFVNGTVAPATATIAIRSAALRFSGGLTNAASIVCSAGTCDFFGNINNVANQPTTGRIVVTANSQATFYGNVVNQGTIQVSAAGLVTSTALFLGNLSGNGVAGSGSVFLEGDVAPGSSLGTMAFGGDVSIGAASTVHIELAGTTPGLQFDRITAVESLSLSGTLAVTLANGFTPVAGQTFDLFDWGSRTGTFATLQLPALAGLGWNTSQLYTTGVISVVATAMAGDFNGDGHVDAADYTVWRNGLGGAYSQSDYALWKANFGQTGGSGAGSTGLGNLAAVPEPASGWLFGALAIVIMRGCYRRRMLRCAP